MKTCDPVTTIQGDRDLLARSCKSLRGSRAHSSRMWRSGPGDLPEWRAQLESLPFHPVRGQKYRWGRKISKGQSAKSIQITHPSGTWTHLRQRKDVCIRKPASCIRKLESCARRLEFWNYKQRTQKLRWQKLETTEMMISKKMHEKQPVMVEGWLDN